MAFKVFNNRDEAGRESRVWRDTERDQIRAQLMAVALASALPSHPYSGSDPRGGRPLKTGSNICYNSHQERHWSKTCLHLAKRAPTGPCPLCKKKVHWKDCPLSPQGGREVILTPRSKKGSSPNQLPISGTVDYKPDNCHLV